MSIEKCGTVGFSICLANGSFSELEGLLSSHLMILCFSILRLLSSKNRRLPLQLWQLLASKTRSAGCLISQIINDSCRFFNKTATMRMGTKQAHSSSHFLLIVLIDLTYTTEKGWGCGLLCFSISKILSTFNFKLFPNLILELA